MYMYLGIALYDPVSHTLAPVKTLRIPTLYDSNLLYKGPYIVDYLKLGELVCILYHIP